MCWLYVCLTLMLQIRNKYRVGRAKSRSASCWGTISQRFWVLTNYVDEMRSFLVCNTIQHAVILSDGSLCHWWRADVSMKSIMLYEQPVFFPSNEAKWNASDYCVCVSCNLMQPPSVFAWWYVFLSSPTQRQRNPVKFPLRTQQYIYAVMLPHDVQKTLVCDIVDAPSDTPRRCLSSVDEGRGW